jgi:hypothetical protein
VNAGDPGINCHFSVSDLGGTRPDDGNSLSAEHMGYYFRNPMSSSDDKRAANAVYREGGRLLRAISWGTGREVDGKRESGLPYHRCIGA